MLSQRLLYLIFLILIISCRREETALLIPVEPPVPPKISVINKQDQNCSMPFDVRFSAVVSNVTGNEKYYWIIDGIEYQGIFPKVQVSDTGTIEVKLVVINEIGSDERIQYFDYLSTTLPVLPAFNYGAQNNNYRIPAKINFKDLSQRASSVHWDFGDGYQSTLRDPQHTYTIPGTYVVTLTAMCDSDTDQVSLNVKILDQPDFIRFNYFELLKIPDGYLPENQDDDTYGGDFYVKLYRGNFKYGESDVFSNRSKTPFHWECPDDWNGDYRLIFYPFEVYYAELWDQNDGDDVLVMSAQIDASYLRNNYYPTTLFFQNDDFEFKILMSYED